MDCAICCDTLEVNNDTIKLICDHTFHKKCIKQWFETSSNNNNVLCCPYCRTLTQKPIITYKNEITNKIYKTKCIKRKTCIINNSLTSFVIKQLQDQLPKAWLDINNKNLQPLFKLITNNESIYITSFLRSYLLYTERKDNIILLEREDSIGDKYYDLDSYHIIVGIFTNTDFNICYEWCYQLLHLLKKDYSIFYGLFYNTILNDLALNTMVNLNLENNKSMFQAIYASTVYSLLNKFQHLNEDNAILPNLETFIYYSDNQYTKEQLQHIVDYQKKYLDNNIILLNNYSTMYL